MTTTQKFTVGQRVEYTNDNGEVRQGVVVRHGNIGVAVNLDDGRHIMVRARALRVVA